MSLFSLFGTLETGLIFSLVALGMLISFRILNFPGLIADGNFLMGNTVATTLIASRYDSFMSTPGGTLADVVAGFITGWLNMCLKIMDLLANISMMIILYSVNLRIMDKPNVSFTSESTIFPLLQPEWMPDYVFRPALLGVVVVIIKLLVDWFFSTQIGLSLRATNANPRMARIQGIATGAATLASTALSNALVTLAGALYMQTQNGADVSTGIGTIVIGLAAIIIGETVLPARRLVLTTLTVAVGAILYRFFITLASSNDFVGLQAQDLNMVTATLVVITLVPPGVHHEVFDKLAKITTKGS